MRKSDRRSAEQQSGRAQLQLPLRDLVREALFETVIVSGLEFVGEVLEEERTALLRAALSARPAAACTARRFCAEFIESGRAAGRSGAAPGPLRPWPRIEFTELASMECARSAEAARARADAGGSLDAALCAVFGAITQRA